MGRVPETVRGLLVVFALAGVLPPAACPAGERAPTTVDEWVQREQAFLRRYLKVLRRASHDYRTDYPMPPLLTPSIIDLFTGYIAPIHQLEEDILYGALQEHLSEQQWADLRLVIADQREEAEVLKDVQRALAKYDRGRKSQAVASLDLFANLINRHLKFQHARVLLPIEGALEPQDHAAIVARLALREQELLGQDGRARYEQLLSAVERELIKINGAVW